MSSQGKAKNPTLKKPSDKKASVKKEATPVSTAFSTALAERMRGSLRMFAMSSLRRVVRGDDDEDGGPGKKRGGLMITAAAKNMLNCELEWSLARIVNEALVFAPKKMTTDGKRMHVSMTPGAFAFGAMSLGVLPEVMNPLPLIPNALNEKEIEEINVAYRNFAEHEENEKKKKKKKSKKRQHQQHTAKAKTNE